MTGEGHGDAIVQHIVAWPRVAGGDRHADRLIRRPGGRPISPLAPPGRTIPAYHPATALGQNLSQT